MTTPLGGRYMPFKTQDANNIHRIWTLRLLPFLFYLSCFQIPAAKLKRERCGFSLAKAVKPTRRSCKIMSYIPVWKTPGIPHKLGLAGIFHLAKYEYEFSWSISVVPFCFTIPNSFLPPNSFPLGKGYKLNPGVCFTHHLQLVNGLLNVAVCRITLAGGRV